jgi:hypothetical protein
VDRDAVVAEAIDRVCQQGAISLQADLAREVATLLPADAASTADQLVEVIDEVLPRRQAGAWNCIRPPREWSPTGSTAGPCPSTSPTGA